MEKFTYVGRVHNMAERLAAVNIAEMAAVLNEAGIPDRLGCNFDDWPEGAQKAAIVAHEGRAKLAVELQAQAIRMYCLSQFSVVAVHNAGVEQYLLENGYIK